MSFWRILITVVAVANPFMIFPQLKKMVSEKSSKAVSLNFLGTLALIQAVWAVHGYRIRDNTVMWSNGLAALSSIATLITALYFR
jgi:uncharacterized protein with PQ loop repeat